MKLIGIKSVPSKAETGTNKETVTHRWASRVGMYNDDPIWGEIFQNVRDGRAKRGVVSETAKPPK